MGKTIIVKKTNSQQKKFCLNCGMDITHKPAQSKFCCPTCKQTYYDGATTRFEFREKFFM